jgi:hypothetical protein
MAVDRAAGIVSVANHHFMDADANDDGSDEQDAADNN